MNKSERPYNIITNVAKVVAIYKETLFKVWIPNT